MESIGASKFKEQCLSLLDHLSPEGLIITKHGRPVAQLLPYPPPSKNLLGALSGKLEIRGDILSTGVSWEADG